MINNDLKTEVSKINWFHRINLGNGIITPGGDDSPIKLKKLGIPEDLRGKTVLDIGAWDGFFSFEAERRGAKRVLATDYFCWGGDGCGSKAGFELARKTLNSRVEDMEIDVLDLSPEKIGSFDLVLFLGVLYHMKHPMLALEKVFNVTKEQLILETHVDMLFCKRPAMAFYPQDELNKDPTNWIGPNPAAVEGMLRTVGFKKVKIYSYFFSFPFRIGIAISHKIRRNQPLLPTIQQNRVVFHAWK